jgi:hypothetical protein
VDHEDDDSVAFNIKDTWHFNQNESGSLTGDEIVTIPNVLLLVRTAVLLLGSRLLVQNLKWDTINESHCNLIMFNNSESAMV